MWRGTPTRGSMCASCAACSAMCRAAMRATTWSPDTFPAVFATRARSAESRRKRGTRSRSIAPPTTRPRSNPAKRYKNKKLLRPAYHPANQCCGSESFCYGVPDPTFKKLWIRFLRNCDFYLNLVSFNSQNCAIDPFFMDFINISIQFQILTRIRNLELRIRSRQKVPVLVDPDPQHCC
jgi:hypothetical protein